MENVSGDLVPDFTMGILHLLVSLNQGGIECWLLSLLPLIDTRKYQMDFFCLQRSETKSWPLWTRSYL